MKYILFAALCLFCAFSVRAQYFNQRYPLNSKWDTHIYNATENSGRYLAIGSGYDSSLNIDLSLDTPTYNILLLDAAGNIVHDTLYTDSVLINVFSSHPIFNSDGNFIVFFQAYLASSPYMGLLHLDSSGNILSRVLSPSPTDGGVSDVKHYGNDWLTLDQGGSVFSFTKRDSALNVIWSRPFPSPIWGARLMSTSISQTPGGYLFIETVTNMIPFWTSTTSTFGYTKIIHTDTAGNQIWSYDTPHDQFILGSCVIRTADNGMVYCGHRGIKYVLSAPNVIIYDKGWIQKLDSNRNIVWTDSISLGTEHNQGHISIVKELPDHSIIAAGDIMKAFDASDVDTVCRTNPFLVKYSSDGTVLWRRKYRYLADSSVYTQAFDLQQTSDGGFLLAADANSGAYSAIGYSGWLIKVDSNGYSEPGHEFVNILENEDNRISAYPNPTTGNLTVTVPHPGTLYVTNVLGQHVATYSLIRNKNEITLPHLRAGLYMGIFKSDQGEISEVKIIYQP